MDNMDSSKGQPNSKKLTPDIIELIAYLDKNGVKKQYIDKMKFSENGNQIKIHVDKFSDAFMEKENGNFKGLSDLPEIWFRDLKSETDCKKLINIHPQKELIRNLSCHTSTKESWIEIEPAKDYPYEIETRIVVPKFENIYSWFPKFQLVKNAPAPAIREKATKKVHNLCVELRQRIKNIKITSELKDLINFNILNKKPKLKFKNPNKGDSKKFVFQWDKFQISYNISSRSFSNITEPYSKIVSKIENSYELNALEKNLVEAREICKSIHSPKDLISCRVDFSIEECCIRILIKYHNFNMQYKLNGLNDDVQNVEDILTEHLEHIENDKKIDQDNFNKIALRIQKSPCYENILAQIIIDTIRNKPTKKGGIVKITLIKEVYEIFHPFGSFCFFSENDITNMLKELKKCKIITSKSAKIYISDEKITGLIHKNKIGKPYDIFNDLDWAEAILDPDLRLEWNELICLLDHPAVYCVEPVKFLSLFQGAPEDVIEYIKILLNMGSESQKVLSMLILQTLGRQKYLEDFKLRSTDSSFDD